MNTAVLRIDGVQTIIGVYIPLRSIVRIKESNTKMSVYDLKIVLRIGENNKTHLLYSNSLSWKGAPGNAYRHVISYSPVPLSCTGISGFSAPKNLGSPHLHKSL